MRHISSLIFDIALMTLISIRILTHSWICTSTFASIAKAYANECEYFVRLTHDQNFCAVNRALACTQFISMYECCLCAKNTIFQEREGVFCLVLHLLLHKICFYFAAVFMFYAFFWHWVNHLLIVRHALIHTG